MPATPTSPRFVRVLRPSFRRLFPLLLVVACARSAAVPAPQPDARLASAPPLTDSGAVLALVGAELPGAHVRHLIDRFQCRPREAACIDVEHWASAWTRRPEPLLAELADAAGAVLVPPDRPRTPPCPWTATPDAPVGYLAWLERPVFRGDSALVHVRLRCLDTTNRATGATVREREYALTRQRETWTIVATTR